MPQDSDPLDGWPIDAVLKMAKPAKNDVYGGLYRYVRKTLSQFLTRIYTLDLHFQLVQMNAIELDNTFELSKEPERLFDRIEVGFQQIQVQAIETDRTQVSNLFDHSHLGPTIAFTVFGRLLRKFEVNPYATLISLFQNAIQETLQRPEYHKYHVEATRIALGHIPPEPEPYANMRFNMSFVRSMRVMGFFLDHAELFNRYIILTRGLEHACKAGIGAKTKNSIMEGCPIGLKKDFTREDFYNLESSGHHGTEIYIEWIRENPPLLKRAPWCRLSAHLLATT